MPQYLIKYLDGDSETLTAERVDASGSQYIAWVGEGSVTTYISAANVRSIVRQPEEEARS
ncbi:hypothetical protein ACFVFF_23285 [Streptomyces sp. NPDC057680]|uniref:hypothetical protein n=1 Tax=Streptomyces sp. NPDC057680 TaxID=3346208 RepID=UPI0036C07C00